MQENEVLAPLFPLERDPYTALFGVFDGIGQQIVKNLLDADVVSPELFGKRGSTST